MASAIHNQPRRWTAQPVSSPDQTIARPAQHFAGVAHCRLSSWSVQPTAITAHGQPSPYTAPPMVSQALVQTSAGLGKPSPVHRRPRPWLAQPISGTIYGRPNAWPPKPMAGADHCRPSSWPVHRRASPANGQPISPWPSQYMVSQIHRQPRP
jgi:hypothetical protein